MELVITGIYASLCTLLFFILSVAVIVQRRSNKVSLGSGKIDALSKAVRAHGNFAEYVPICLILLAVAELNTNANVFLHIAGGLLVLGRVLHAYGLVTKNGASAPRVYGMLCTFAVMLSLAVWNLFAIFTW